jgi:hypothetical protein
MAWNSRLLAESSGDPLGPAANDGFFPHRPRVAGTGMSVQMFITDRIPARRPKTMKNPNENERYRRERTSVTASDHSRSSEVSICALAAPEIFSMTDRVFAASRA